MDQLIFSGNDRNRILTPAALTWNILVDVGAVVGHWGGSVGKYSAYTGYTAGIPTVDAGTDRRWLAFGVRFNEVVSGRTTVSASTDFALLNRLDALGAALAS